MRIPSLHITEDKLILVINRIKKDVELNKLSTKELANRILYESRGVSCNNRSIKITSERIEKKAKQLLRAGKKDTYLLADLIYNLRKKKRHKGIRKINEEDREWGQLKKLASVCIDFCNDFELERRKGFLIYLELAFPKITSTRQYISKFINMSESIAQEYEFIQEIQSDTNPTETREIHDLYVSTIARRTGIPEPYDKMPDKYVYFKRVRELTDEMDIPYDIYIEAQFEGLAWADSFPGPSQLVGDKAIERLNKYMYNRKLRRGARKENKKQSLGDVLNRIKNG